MPEERDLDRLIDAALGTYSDLRFDENLAERVLARLANEPSPRPRLAWVPWASVAVPAALCLLLLVHSGVSKPHAAPPIQSAQTYNPADIPVRPTSLANRAPKTARQINHIAPHALAAIAVAQPLPKLDVFPTPTPLTRQERDLAVYVAHTPKAEQEALAQAEQEPMPLTVASIHVMPLEAPDDGANTN